MKEKTIFKHLIPIQIRLNDIDLLGHVNNSNILEYFDLGKVKYLESLNILYSKEGNYLWVIVHYDVDFHQQITQNDTIYVGTRATKIGRRSIHTEQKLLSTDGVEMCTCTTVLCCHDLPNKCPMEIPNWAREAINNDVQQ